MEHYTLPHRHNQSMSQLMSHLPNIEEFPQIYLNN